MSLGHLISGSLQPLIRMKPCRPSSTSRPNRHAFTSFISPFFLLWRSLCARACKSSSQGLRRLLTVAFSLALGARHRERGLGIRNHSRSLRQVNLQVSLKTSNLTASTSRVSISSKTISPVSLNFGIAISRTDCPAGPSIIAVSKAG